MTATRINAKRTPWMLAMCAAAIVGGSALAAVQADDFNDNVRAAFWKIVAPSTTKVKETGSKLKFRSSSAAGGERRAAYVSKNWTVQGEMNNTITFDYSINVANLTGTKKAAIGVWTEEPDDASALQVVVIQKASGWTIELDLFVDGDSVIHKEAPLTHSNGTVKIIYNQATDKMVVKVDDQTKIAVPHLNNGYGPFELDIELFAWSNKTTFGYGDVWMDNFRLTGTIND